MGKCKIYLGGVNNHSKTMEVVSFLNTVDLEVVYPSKESSLPFRISLLLQCDSIYLLDGWHNDKIADIECYIARTYNIGIFFENKIIPMNNATSVIENAIHEATGITLDSYSQNKRSDPLFFCRLIFAKHATDMGMSKDEIARILNITVQTVGWMLRKYPDEVKYNPSFRDNAMAVEYIINTTNISSNEK